MRRARVDWLDRAVLLIVTLALGSVAWSAGITNDSFNGMELNSDWTVNDPDGDDTIALTGDGGLKVILGTAEDSWESSRGGAVFILTGGPSSDSYALETYVDMASTGTFMDHFIAGIVLVDGGNTSQYPFELSWGLHNSGSRWEVSLQRPGTTLMDQAVTLDAAYMRLERDGTAKQWSAYFKAQKDDSWTLLGAVVDSDLPGGGTTGTLSVGLFCKTWGSASAATAVFDYWSVVEPGAAESPAPADGEEDVAQNVVLNWTAGEDSSSHTVYFGTSFDDVNDASVSNPLGVLVGEDQQASSFDPEGLLEFGQTYYWRVDEALIKGAVWSFTVEPFAYAVGADSITVTASSSKSASEASENVIDGSGLNADDLHSVAVADMWRTKSGDTDPWILFTFAEPLKLYEMLVWNHNSETESDLGIGIREATVEYSLDGSNWTSLGTLEFAQATGLADYAANTTVAFDGAAAQYVKVTPISNWGGLLVQYGLSEIRFLHIPVQARGPEPANGDVDVSVESDLTWRSGREAVTHNVYWGTDPTALTLLDSVDEATYDLDTLALDTTYYWRIDEVNEAEAVSPWEGPTWSFTTAEYLVVDDFESYTDYEGEAIFQIWLDKWTSAATYGGCQVGHTDAPYAETSIVHSGSQSMPLYYDNTSETFSETTLSLSQDWTTSGIKSLSLWFHGTLGNAGQLYVKINGTKVTYDGGADDIAVVGWLPWNIDLSTVGVSANHITSLTLGVAGTSSGLLYIDDIRLYPRTPEYITPVAPDTTNLVAYYALNGNANDTSGKGHNGTVVGAPTYEDGVNGKAICVNGTTDFIDLGKPSDWPAGRSPRSLSVWLKTSSIATGYRTPVAYGTASGGQAMCIAQNETTIYGSAYGDDLVVADFWQTDVWYHICLTYDGTTARLYANGFEIASGEKDWNLVISVARIGQQINDYSEFWDGSIDEVRLYDRALTAEEVASLAGKTDAMPKAF